jgi:subtilisin family serine protease
MSIKRLNIRLVGFIAVMIFVVVFFLLNKNLKSDNPNSELIQIINAEGVFPYKSEIKPKIGIIDTGISVNKYLPFEQVDQKILDDLMSKSSKKIHGTMIAGIMISNGNKNHQPQGLIPKSKIFSIQTGNDMGTTSEKLAEAINLAIDNDVKIINISLATKKDTKPLRDAIDRALKHNIIVIASDGNEGKSGKYFPASYDGVISVGAIDMKGNLLGESNLNSIDIFAPGEGILTSAPNSEQKSFILPGNSGAVPIVTSAVAVLITKYPELEPEQVKKILISSSTIKEQERGKVRILNVKNALNQAKKINSN